MTGSVILLVIFASAIGYATFIENASGTKVAKELIYNAKWFEVLLFLLIINLAGSIFKYNLIARKKWTILMFHLAFICILLGSAITRYLGYEGIMHIREGESSNEILIDDTALQIEINDNGKVVKNSYKVNFGAGKSNEFDKEFTINNKRITVSNQLFVPDALETLEQTDNGEPAAGIFLMSGAEESVDFTLFGNQPYIAGGTSFGFDKSNKYDINFFIKDDDLYLVSTKPFTKTGTLASGMIDRDHQISILPDTPCKTEQNTVYRSGKVVFMVRGFYPKAQKLLTPAHVLSKEMVETGNDAIAVEVSDGKQTQLVNVFSNGENAPIATECNINGTLVRLKYGKMSKELPFSITLRDFQLERYPGSMSPSSYASEITVNDKELKSIQPYRIYMNNILNYRGYRFFQSSYDEDEAGTILSVNHDYWGTLVSYLGYFFMFLGMGLTLFNKNSRFRKILGALSDLQSRRKQILPILLPFILFSGTLLQAQNSNKEQHLQKLGSLLVQDKAQGRIEPLGTYASDVLRKLSKHNTYKNKSAEEVVIEMSVRPEIWKNEPLIKVAHDGLAKELNAENGFVTYNSLFDQNQNYKLSGQVEQAYRKEEAQRNKYEKELINVDERVNICTSIYLHELLALFPSTTNSDQNWTTSTQTFQSTKTGSGVCPYHGATGMGMGMSQMSSNEDESSDNSEMTETSMPPATVAGHCTRNDVSACPAFSENESDLGAHYFDAYSIALKDNNWQTADSALNAISEYQKKYDSEHIPSDSRIKAELLYNNLNIFVNLMIAYLIIGILILALHFLNIFKPGRFTTNILKYAIYPLGLLFILYTFGLGFRWYISGHAPWSNGYESMIFVGWAGSLAGLVFSKKSPLAFAVTAILSAIALSVAAMSWMNPEITNLVPVLKSYWLIVHVAVITSSYGFLAMGAILGFLNLILIIFRNTKNQIRINDILLEISYIIELSLIVGLFLLTIGTFLGGIWANESWGRYWGWDAKETWALVSVLVYAVIVHLRMIPKMNNIYVLSTAALLGFSSVIMTFVGVNYYLSGMHSYGQGNPPPVPGWVYLLVLIIGIVAYFAFRQFFNKKANQQS